MRAAAYGSSSPVIRVGIPLPAGELVEYGIASGLPLMFSADAFARTNVKREFVGFKLAAAQAIPNHADCALDSAGYVAAAHYGDYRWSIDEYLDLAELPAFGQFASPQALCSAVDVPGSGQSGNRAPARARQIVRVECPAFFTNQRTSGLPPAADHTVPVNTD